jgi:hypothetical protein
MFQFVHFYQLINNNCVEISAKAMEKRTTGATALIAVAPVWLYIFGNSSHYLFAIDDDTAVFVVLCERLYCITFGTDGDA